MFETLSQKIFLVYSDPISEKLVIGLEFKEEEKMSTALKIPLTSAEIGILWNQYTLDTMSLYVEKFALACEQDEKIYDIIREAVMLMEKTSAQVRHIFQKEGIPIPMGFSEEDVNLDAPPLYSSIFRLQYIKHKFNLRMVMNGLNLARSSRSDIRKFYHDLTIAILRLDDRATNLLLDKGLYIRAPYISIPDHAEFVQQQNFMGRFFGGAERKLLAIEIAGLFYNIQNNLIGKMLLTGFSQVAQSTDIQRYFMRGIEIANKHIDIFSSALHAEDVPIPMPWDSGVTNSMVAPFSDKLMLQHIAILNQVGITAYATCMSESMRKDLLIDYVRLAAEIGQYTADGAALLIDNNWMEEPPKTVDHQELRLQ